MNPRPSAPACPACGSALTRSHRNRMEQLAPGHRRWRCKGSTCGWAGLLPHAQDTLTPAPKAEPDAISKPGRWSALWQRRQARKLSRITLTVAGGGLVAAVAMAFVMQRPQPESVMVGPHVVTRGTHLEGERIPTSHPLRALLPAAAMEVEPAGYVEDRPSALRVRRHCAWGLPGRNPYRGSAVQALQTATLSATVVKQLAADMRTGKRVDRVTITNDGIRAWRTGREFDAQHVAMTYGMTLCADTRVNFNPGHREEGDLYEAMDEDGRIYAVMVPDVCGNVSVLGQRYAKAPAPSASGAETASTMADDPRPWMRVPPEQRIRELPRALRFADNDPAQRDADSAGGEARTVATPGSLALSGLALVLALWLGRRRRA